MLDICWCVLLVETCQLCQVLNPFPVLAALAVSGCQMSHYMPVEYPCKPVTDIHL